MAHQNGRRASLGDRISMEHRMSIDLPSTSPATSVPVPPQRQPSVPAEEPIPRVKSIAPCIFVPLERDITKPRDPPRTRVDKLERRLSAVAAQRPGVMENLAYMAGRQRLSILQYGRQTEAVTGIPQGPNPSVPPEEVDWLMENMSAPAPNNREDLNLREEGEDLKRRLDRTAAGMPPPGGPMPLREEVARDLADTFIKAAEHGRQYNGIVDNRVHDLSQRLEKERKVLEEAGKRPEERHRHT